MVSEAVVDVVVAVKEQELVAEGAGDSKGVLVELIAKLRNDESTLEGSPLLPFWDGPRPTGNELDANHDACRFLVRVTVGHQLSHY